MLPYSSTPTSSCPSSLGTVPRNFAYMRHNSLYNVAPTEVRSAHMPATTGVLPMTIRVGNPVATYKLNKIESSQPNSDHVFLHMEKFCALDALWYPQWMRLSVYCEMFREIILAVIKAALERPERTNFLLTIGRILALPDEGPGIDGNPLCSRYHWRSPLHQVLWRELLQGEIPGSPQFQLYPQPPQRPRIDIAQFQRAMLPHISTPVPELTVRPWRRLLASKSYNHCFTAASYCLP